MTTHKILGGEVNLYKRENSDKWQCSTYLNGRNHRMSTKEEHLTQARAIAEDWYLELRGKHRRGELKKNEKSFNLAADQFEREYEVITEGQRNPHYVEQHTRRLRLYLRPFFGKLGLSEVTAGKITDYRIWRRSAEKKPARSTLHQEMVTLRQTLKSAMRHGWLTHLPDTSTPYKTSGKIAHRAWFSPEEYRALYEATRKRARAAKGKRWQKECEQFHDFILFMANTGLRPDEAWRLEFRDVTIVEDYGTEETILEIQVRGKRGVGYCKSTTGAVRPFQRLFARATPEDENAPSPIAKIFPSRQRELMKRVLTELDLRKDREGNQRTTYSLRHTYICLRLMEGADIYQIAKNCRTSVEMIEKYYASHIKTSLDASAINVRKPKIKRILEEQDD